MIIDGHHGEGVEPGDVELPAGHYLIEKSKRRKDSGEEKPGLECRTVNKIHDRMQCVKLTIAKRGHVGPKSTVNRDIATETGHGQARRL